MSTRSPDTRERLVASLLPVVRFGLRHGPAPLRRVIRDQIIRRYVAWRQIPLDFRLSDGLRVRGDLRDVIVRSLYMDGTWDPSLRDLLAAQLSEGDVFVDVGANFGLFSLVASRMVGASGAVIAIEASPTTFARLLDHLRVNEADNVVAVNVAASDHVGHVSIHSSDATNPGASTIVADAQELAARHATFEAEIEAKPLHEIVPRALWPRIKAIKIDVEGAEAEVLRGLEPMLSALPAETAIAVEITRSLLSRVYGLTPQQLLAPFRARGFIAYQRAEDSGPPTPLGDGDPVFNAWETADLILRRVPI
ncbi:FkbM family methyltransferase [Elioraea sp.]|uniref:FkbM family methyltransferase n=1 Tax=Elioraea sp. TaxID=2185103 RepID=UPI0025BABD6F|nr:FkbM family methyltransferase [Elioraea sp.]